MLEEHRGRNTLSPAKSELYLGNNLVLYCWQVNNNNPKRGFNQDGKAILSFDGGRELVVIYDAPATQEGFDAGRASSFFPFTAKTSLVPIFKEGEHKPADEMMRDAVASLNDLILEEARRTSHNPQCSAVLVLTEPDPGSTSPYVYIASAGDMQYIFATLDKGVVVSTPKEGMGLGCSSREILDNLQTTGGHLYTDRKIIVFSDGVAEDTPDVVKLLRDNANVSSSILTGMIDRHITARKMPDISVPDDELIAMLTRRS